MQASLIPLSHSDARTIRHARQAVALVLNGAVRNLESQYGPADYQDRTPIIQQLFTQVTAEIAGWDIAQAEELADAGVPGHERERATAQLAKGRPAIDLDAATRFLRHYASPSAIHELIVALTDDGTASMDTADAAVLAMYKEVAKDLGADWATD
jgi:hypothetical protein